METLEFAMRVCESAHHTADYYETKKFQMLLVSSAVVGFSSTLFTLSKSPILTYGALALGGFAILSILSYVFAAKPKIPKGKAYSRRFWLANYDARKPLDDNLRQYKKMYSGLSTSEMLNDTLAFTTTLFNMTQSKVRVVSMMSRFLALGFISLLASFAAFAAGVV
ncbi:hypothetical protein HYS54_03745 [Candidatus Micrarchaeota archaeon]|nr:hypothetical protein [Candidatus Micrarchaeota archaeon]